jgi:glycosyltransferase involved in cell wall biosynthesis
MERQIVERPAETARDLSPMKVCFIVGTLGRGGAERQLIFMLRALQLEGVKTTLLCLTMGEAFEKEVKKLGVDIVWVGSSRNRLLRLWQMIKAIRKHPVDIIQSSHFYTNIYAAVAGRILRIRNIGAIRNNLSSEIAADRIFGRWQVDLPEHLIANSELAISRAFARGLKPRKIDLLKNIVELPHATENQFVGVGIVKIIFVGRLVQQKRPEMFIKLARQLRRDLPKTDLTFQIIGDGPLRRDLEKLRENYGLSGDEIQFLGEQSEMASVYLCSDILVLTSEFEGTPNVLLEAMSFGIPVVATRVGGVPEILTEKSGILVDPADFAGLVEATTKLILNPELRRTLGISGRDYVARNHSLEYLRKRLMGIYKKLLGITQTDA